MIYNHLVHLAARATGSVHFSVSLGAVSEAGARGGDRSSLRRRRAQLGQAIQLERQVRLQLAGPQRTTAHWTTRQL